MDTKNLNLRQFIPHDFSSQQDVAYIAVYEFWYRIWGDLHREIGGPELESDSFTKQDEILALFHGSQPISLVCHRFADFLNPQFLHDSYMRSWSQAAVNKVKSVGRFGVLGCQIAVEPNMNKFGENLSIKKLISAISIGHLLHAKPDFILGMMRVDKGMNRVFSEMGAIEIDESQGMYYDKAYSFLAFAPSKKPVTIPEPYQSVAIEIYNKSKVKPFLGFINTRRLENEKDRFFSTRRVG